jgi:CheY-like chemotaxis protein
MAVTAVNTYIVRKMLKSIGYDMIAAYDGTTGVNLAQQEYPNLILLDLNLPDISGMHIIDHLRRIPELDNTPIIALTATDSPSVKEACLAAGGNDYLEKPVSQARLVATMEKYLGLRV